MANHIVLFSEEDTLFRLMETALNRTLSPMAEKALHYFFGKDIREQTEYLTNLSSSLGLPPTMKGIVCEQEEKFEALLTEADFLVVERTPITRGILERCRSRLKLVQKFGINYKNIDIDAAREMGIPVANLLRPVTISVAEHVILLILALSRNLAMAHQTALARREARDGLRSEGPPRTSYNWGRIPVQLVSGKTLGIVGLGEIGVEVAKRARSLGMKIVYHDLVRIPKDVEGELSANYSPTLLQLMEESDFVTFHIPYTTSTEKVVNHEVLSHMKQGAFLINTSRGGIVDENALYKVISEGKIAGAALDVYRWEPVPSDNHLLSTDKILWSTHNAGGTPEFMLEESRMVLYNIARALKGKEPENWVNRL